MKNIKIFLFIIFLLFCKNLIFAQCTLSPTELIPEGDFESGMGTMTSPVAGGCKEITNNASHNGHGCGYSAFQNTANTPHLGLNAYLYDGGSAAGQLICKSVTIDKSKTYDVSAYYKSAAAVGNAIGNVANLRMTIDGVQIGAGWGAVTNQGAYDKNECYYKYGGVGTVTVNVCVEFQPTINTGGGGSYSSGNDVLIDDFSMKEITSGSCSAGTCTYTGTTVGMPVSLISFLCNQIDNNSLKLQWTSTSEYNFLYYSIERSDDGINFSEIGIVNSKGSINSYNNYDFIDANYIKSYYYRLKNVDKDGKFVYSNIIFSFKEPNYLLIINKENNNEIIIKTVVKENTKWNIVVYSLLGQEYNNDNFQLVEGENNILLKKVGNDNIKIIKITDEKGKIILSQIVIY